MKSRRALVTLGAAIVVGALLTAGCTAAAPAPTAAPAAPTKAAEPAKPAAAAPTAAPAAAPTAAPKVDFPVKGKAITVIAPYAPGGSVDMEARMLAQMLEKDLGATTTVVNKPGASSLIGATELAKSKPDGYNIIVLALNTLTSVLLDPAQKAPISRKDFQMVSMFSITPTILYVKADSPFKDGADLVKAAKANPGKVTIGTSGMLTADHLSPVLLEKVSGTSFAYVHFDSAGQTVTGVLGGHVDVGASVLSGAQGTQVKNGAIRILGILDSRRSPFFPEVTTFEEMGYKAGLVSSHAIAVPAGTPKEIVDLLSNTIKKGLESDSVKEALAKQTFAGLYMDPAQTEAHFAELEASTKELAELARKGTK